MRSHGGRRAACEYSEADDDTMRWYEWRNPIGAGKKKEQTYFVPARDDYDRRLSSSTAIRWMRRMRPRPLRTRVPKTATRGRPELVPVPETSWLYGEIITESKWRMWFRNCSGLNQNYPNPFNPTTQIPSPQQGRIHDTDGVQRAWPESGQPLAGKLPAASMRSGLTPPTWPTRLFSTY